MKDFNVIINNNSDIISATYHEKANSSIGFGANTYEIEIAHNSVYFTNEESFLKVLEGVQKFSRHYLLLLTSQNFWSLAEYLLFGSQNERL